MVNERSIERDSILLVGASPPPYGGVSIHIQRLGDLLPHYQLQARVIDPLRLIDAMKKRDFSSVAGSLRPFLRSGGNIIHIHTSGWNMQKAFITSLATLSRRNKVMVTLHSLRSVQDRLNPFEAFLIARSLGRCSNLIVVSEAIRDGIRQFPIEPGIISVIPAFLPPTPKTEDYQHIPRELWEFIDTHSPVISANAYRITFYENHDLYGIDMCIELCSRLKNDYPDIGFVFCLPDIGDRSYYTKLNRLISTKGLGDHFRLVTDPFQFYPILERSTLYVRPTNTDGDSVSIREALFFRVPVVASDAVIRPQGVNLFRTRDCDDFTRTVIRTLDKERRQGRVHPDLPQQDNGRRIIELYQQLLTED